MVPFLIKKNHHGDHTGYFQNDDIYQQKPSAKNFESRILKNADFLVISTGSDLHFYFYGLAVVLRQLRTPTGCLEGL